MDIFSSAAYNFTGYSIPFIITALTLVSLGIYVLLKNKKSWLNQALFYFVAIVLGGWLVSTMFMISSLSAETAYFWARMYYSTIAFIPTFALLVCLIYLRIDKQQMVLLGSILFSLAATVLSWATPFIIDGVIKYEWGYYPRAAVGHIPYLIIFGAILATVVFNYYLGIKNADTPAKKGIVELLFFGYAFGTLGATDYLPSYGFDYFPFGYLTTYLYILLHIYAIKKHSSFLSPVHESDVPKKFKYNLDSGRSYLIKSTGTKTGLEVFVDQVMGGKHGLLVTRTNPDKIKSETPLKKTPIIWLTEIKGENCIDPSSLEELAFTINKFIESSPHSVMFVEGLPYLTSYNDFSLVVRVLRSLKDAVSTKNSILIVSANSQNFSPTDFSLIEDEFTELKVK